MRFFSRNRRVATKRCTITNQELPTSEFYANSTQPDGLHPYSKTADDLRRYVSRITNGKVGVTRLRAIFNNKQTA